MTDEARRRRCDPVETWFVNGEATVKKEGEFEILNSSGGWVPSDGLGELTIKEEEDKHQQCEDGCRISDLTVTHERSIYK
jgi:hypothetical protein